ncbi:MAG: polysaccharide biosynthesis tyrosine autokinase [Nitrospinota bacterium]|nr:MAG: polysaccharide biosynthesis tyrosine autokinase [Nitrospinota bacterium]
MSMKNLPASPAPRESLQRQETEYVYLVPEMEGTPETSLRDYFRIIWRRRWLVLAPLCLLLPLVVLNLSVQKPVYQATATLLIENTNPRIVPIQEVSAPDRSPNFYQTQYEMIRSRSIAEQVVDAFQLDKRPPVQDSALVRFMRSVNRFPSRMLTKMLNLLKPAPPPEQPAPSSRGERRGNDPAEVHRQNVITQFQGAILIEPRKETKLVDISLRGSRPREITAMVNMIAEIYVRQNLENKLAETKKAIDWLTKEGEQLQEKVHQAEMELQSFREQNKFVSLDLGERQNIVLQNLGDLNASYMDTKAQRVELQTRINELRRLSAQDITMIESFPGVLENSLIQSLKNRYIDLKRQYVNLSKRYKEKHPKMVQLRSEMQEVERTIDREVQKIVNSLETEYRSLLAKERAFAGALNAQKNETLNLNKDVITYNTLKRNVETYRELYQAISTRLAETKLTEALATNNVKIVERAVVPAWPLPSRKGAKLLLAIVAGLGLGIGLALLSEHLDTRRFKAADEAEQYLDLPLLGIVPRYKLPHRHEPGIIMLQDPRSIAAEAYRTIRTWIQLSTQTPAQTLLVTSAIPDEGKTTTSANLAVAFAQLGQRVLIMDADLRFPSLHHLFDVPNSTGLTDILVQGRDWREVVQETDLPNLRILPSGVEPPNPTELLSTRRMHSLLAQLKEAFDLVLIDSPVTLSIPDVAILAPRVDGVVLVHYPIKGDKAAVLTAKRLLERAQARLLGIIFNNVQQHESTFYSSYTGGYHNRYAYVPTPAPQDEEPVRHPPETRVDPVPAEADPFPALAPGIPCKIGETVRSGELVCTVHEILWQQQIGTHRADYGFAFLLLDLTLTNEAEDPYLFDPEQTAIYVEEQSTYGKALASLILVNGIEGEVTPQEPHIARCDPITATLEQGFEREEIEGHHTRSGLLVYQVPEETSSFTFAYESEEVQIIIPLTKRTGTTRY